MKFVYNKKNFSHSSRTASRKGRRNGGMREGRKRGKGGRKKGTWWSEFVVDADKTLKFRRRPIVVVYYLRLEASSLTEWAANFGRGDHRELFPPHPTSWNKFKLFLVALWKRSRFGWPFLVDCFRLSRSFLHYASSNSDCVCRRFETKP